MSQQTLVLGILGLVALVLWAQVAFNPVWFVIFPLVMTVGWVVAWRLGRRRSSTPD